MPPKMLKPGICLFTASCALLAAGMASAEETHLYWGDTHLHTSYSVDAYSTGNHTVDPDAAFRFARGEPIISPRSGDKIMIDRPLDFLVVSDHAEMLQLQVRLEEKDPDYLSTPTGKLFYDMIQAGNPRGPFGEISKINTGGGQEVLRDLFNPKIRQNAWNRQVEFADKYNDPGHFTAFIGWEWTSAPEWHNLHRVVFMPEGADVAKRFYPYTSYDSVRPEDLWAWLDKTSKETGAEFVAIPHNSNMSAGFMFDMVDSDGRPISTQYARTRLRWEPVMEITQEKGTSETHPALSTEDEFADFEIRNKLLINVEAPVKPGAYARTALMEGLQIEQSVGVNPYKFGFVGSTDSHTGLTSVVESNYHGKLTNQMLPGDRIDEKTVFPAWELSASGLAAVWATENTRQAIFDAFKRKEVYATTGPRIKLRFFGGFDFRKKDADARDIADVGYKRGVPMGGDITNAPRGKAPTFLIYAVKDPVGANLDRIQVVKGWLDADGKTHEQVFNVSWSEGRQLNADGSLPPVGNSIDKTLVRYKNDIGAAQLSTVWSDPQFDPDQRAFYYARVLEIPTPRQHVFDMVALGLDPKTNEHPLSIQERAYSSPIWYTPAD